MRILSNSAFNALEKRYQVAFEQAISNMKTVGEQTRRIHDLEVQNGVLKVQNHRATSLLNKVGSLQTSKMQLMMENAKLRQTVEDLQNKLQQAEEMYRRSLKVSLIEEEL